MSNNSAKWNPSMPLSINKFITLSKLGVVLYTIGLILCTAISAGMTWGDFEASLFASSLPTDEPLSTLSCPVMISKSENGQVKARFTNHTNRALSTNVRTYISQGYVSEITQLDTPLKLQTGESKTLTWSIEPSEAVWGRLIMVKIYTLRRFPYPSYTGTCGILVINFLGIPGKYLLPLSLVLGLGMLSSGVFILRKEIETKRIASSSLSTLLTALAVVIVIGLVVGLTGNWLVGFLFLMLAVLMTFLLLGTKIRES
jgi:hypothetical protein